MKRIIFAMLAAAAIVGCDEFMDINDNPNQATVSTPDLVLSGALNATASQTFYNQMGAMWAGQWSPSGDVSGFVQEKTYDFNNTYGTGIWTNFYDILNDLKYVQDAGVESGKKGSAAIAKIMSTFLYHKLVDTYNNVPFTDALQGTTVIRPSYDNGQTVYEAITDDLDEAVADLASITDPGDNPGAADIVFGGDYASWIRFANTLKLRLLMRQTEMSGRDAYITAEIAQISGGFLTSNAEVDPGYLQSSGKQNPFWDAYFKSENNTLRNTYNFIRSTAFLQSKLAGDERQYYIMGQVTSRADTMPPTLKFWKLTPSGAAATFKGVTFGDESPSAYSNVSSGIGFGILKSYDMPMVLITASESYFLQAEAVQRSYLAGDAKALYEAGIFASYEQLGVPDPDPETAEHDDYENYISDIAAFDPGNAIEQIISQKWIASVGYGGFEAWADYRRTGFPNVPLSTKAIKTIPVRLYYPNQELQTNADNVAAQGTIDASTSRVFWDAN
jgi:hypothetical protein